jgi:hypothetical protein
MSATLPRRMGRSCSNPESPMTLRKIILSPLVHFFALGALIFAGNWALSDQPTAPRPGEITLSRAEASRLVQQFTATWNRPPTERELEGLMQSWAVEEANVREALALGLDRGDSVIRQRLNLKMQFLAESGAAAMEPEDAVMQDYLDANPDRFTQPARIAFEQVILPDDGNASEIRAALESGADPATLGTASLLPNVLQMTPGPVIDRTFGDGFQDALADMPEGGWHGPVTSAYGQHLVRITSRTKAVLPPLAAVRDRVEAEWRAERARDMRDRFNQALLERYTVDLPDAEEVLGQ